MSLYVLWASLCAGEVKACWSVCGFAFLVPSPQMVATLKSDQEILSRVAANAIGTAALFLCPCDSSPAKDRVAHVGTVCRALQEKCEEVLTGGSGKKDAVIESFAKVAQRGRHSAWSPLCRPR